MYLDCLHLPSRAIAVEECANQHGVEKLLETPPAATMPIEALKPYAKTRRHQVSRKLPCANQKCFCQTPPFSRLGADIYNLHTENIRERG
jgi:hypothetical protein